MYKIVHDHLFIVEGIHSERLSDLLKVMQPVSKVPESRFISKMVRLQTPPLMLEATQHLDIQPFLAH